MNSLLQHLKAVYYAKKMCSVSDIILTKTATIFLQKKIKSIFLKNTKLFFVKWTIIISVKMPDRLIELDEFNLITVYFLLSSLKRLYFPFVWHTGCSD
jgi:hypothetical protein